MSASPETTCARCGRESVEQTLNPRPTDQGICALCWARFTFDPLEGAADVQLGKDVDDALSRVRAVKRRYPRR